MKLIQAMKQIKDLHRKCEDLRNKIGIHCAHASFETPTYGDRQSAQVKEWLQAHEDIVKEILRLQIALQTTNLATSVTIELGGKQVTKSIAEWIHRRKTLAALDSKAWEKLGDKGIREGNGINSMGDKVEVKIVRNFDPTVRDTKLELYRSEPASIDSTLEVVNAVTDLIESR